jgi:hypothetical protein
MVQIVENWALIIGIIVGMLPAEPGEQFATLRVEIQRVEQVQDFPMLIQQKPGDCIAVRVRPEQIEQMGGLIGSVQSIRVRRGRDPDIAFAASEWRADIE